MQRRTSHQLSEAIVPFHADRYAAFREPIIFVLRDVCNDPGQRSANCARVQPCLDLFWYVVERDQEPLVHRGIVTSKSILSMASFNFATEG